MNDGAQALFLNAIPLLALSALYLAATLALVPTLWRERARIRDVDLALVLVYPSLAAAGAILGLLVLADGEPIAGSPLISLAAIVAGAIPALSFFERGRDRGRVVTGARLAREADQLSRRDRERGALVAFTDALGGAADAGAVAQLLVEESTALLGVEFGSLTLIHGSRARGLVALLDGEEVPWWRELDLDLDDPSAIASVAFEAAPFTVYDIESSPAVNQEVAATLGAKSGLWLPLVAGGSVLGVLALATTTRRRAFAPDEVALVQALASEAALALERALSGSALADALAREHLVGRIAHRVRSDLDLDSVLATATEEAAAPSGRRPRSAASRTARSRSRPRTSPRATTGP